MTDLQRQREETKLREATALAEYMRAGDGVEAASDKIGINRARGYALRNWALDNGIDCGPKPKRKSPAPAKAKAPAKPKVTHEILTIPGTDLQVSDQLEIKGTPEQLARFIRTLGAA